MPSQDDQGVGRTGGQVAVNDAESAGQRLSMRKKKEEKCTSDKIGAAKKQRSQIWQNYLTAIVLTRGIDSIRTGVLWKRDTVRGTGIDQGH